MDFSPIYNSIYTVEQSRELIKVLDMCMNESYKKGDEKKTILKNKMSELYFLY